MNLTVRYSVHLFSVGAAATAAAPDEYNQGNDDHAGDSEDDVAIRGVMLVLEEVASVALPMVMVSTDMDHSSVPTVVMSNDYTAFDMTYLNFVHLPGDLGHRGTTRSHVADSAGIAELDHKSESQYHGNNKFLHLNYYIVKI